jgi:hypothetical protein
MAKIGRRRSMFTSFPPVVHHQARGYAQGIKGCLSVHFEPRIIERMLMGKINRSNLQMMTIMHPADIPAWLFAGC